MNLRIPGPTPLPQPVLTAMSRQIINHRGEASEKIVKKINSLMHAVCGASGDVYLIPGSGWAGVESAVVNTIDAGDKVLALSAGYFGEEFADLAKAYGADVDMLQFPDGAGIDPDAVAAKLRDMRDVRAVLVTHNESYTGAAHPLREIAAAVRANSDALLHVDAVSATGAIDTQLDAWGIDTVCTASQKALMGSPGIALLALSDRAVQASTRCKTRRYYFDWKHYHEVYPLLQIPTTAPMTVLYGLEAAADMMLAEGIPNVFARHERVAAFTRARAQALGLDLFAQPNAYSPTLTAVCMPEGVDPVRVRTLAREQGVEFGGSWYRLESKIIRIGHMGMTTEADIDHAMEVLGDVLAQVRA
jgi:aspartate aminotransferase-like enzyme